MLVNALILRRNTMMKNLAGVAQCRGITYVPDYVCNRMGIVNCANEQYGRVGPLGSTVDRAINR